MHNLIRSVACGALLLTLPVVAGGLKVDAPRNNRTATENTVLLSESFESCEQLSYAMPEGWTTRSLGETSGYGEDHWLGLSKAYATRYGFPKPADGEMMVGVFYDDDINKDEWLVSPVIEDVTDKTILSFYWYTVPMYLYAIDRDHVDFENKVFTDRQTVFDFQVMARAVGSEEWNVVFDLENCFSDREYSELSELDYRTMQRAETSLGDYVGENIQLAFRYFGKGGNTLTLDAVSVELPKPDISYTPHYSRLFFGFNDNFGWYPGSVEFYPVNYPVYWENTSNDTNGVDFSWSYPSLDTEGNYAIFTGDDPDMLEVTYRPDYSSEERLVNNFYLLPELNGAGPGGGKAQYRDTYDVLQAGGRPEGYVPMQDPEYPSDPDKMVEVLEKYCATNFDIRQEGYRIHTEENETLGMFAEPIFGYTGNTDAWWLNYCFSQTGTEGKHAYVDGFANLYLPHPEAPLVVNGFKVMANGDLTGADDVPFTVKVYSMTEDGDLVEEPIAQKTIYGRDIKREQYLTRYWLYLDFPLDESVIFDAQGTGYGYMVEVSGYHDERIRYFAPLQTAEPNKHEWAFGFYHLHSSFSDIYPNYTFTDQFGYVANLKDDQGREMYSSFYIGLDACYPWLQLAGGDEMVFSFNGNGDTGFELQGYYDAQEYKVEAPKGYDVFLEGRYTTKVRVASEQELTEDVEIPVTITAPGVRLAVNVPLKKEAGVDNIVEVNNLSADVYNAQGILVMKNASKEDLGDLPAGVYIIGGKKQVIR